MRNNLIYPERGHEHVLRDAEEGRLVKHNTTDFLVVLGVLTSLLLLLFFSCSSLVTHQYVKTRGTRLFFLKKNEYICIQSVNGATRLDGTTRGCRYILTAKMSAD